MPDANPTPLPQPLSPDLLGKMQEYWQAANYLSVGQIYLRDNPLLETPLRIEDVKPRLLGHWGTTTGLNFLYVHLNRLITEHDLNMIYIIGPGHGGPGLVAHSYLEGSYTEHYPAIERSRNGLQRLFRQFSWPYGIPSHVSPEVPGSIHEGGELGYSLAHAYGAAFDNPDLIVACVVGDGEAETGALATSWHSNKFLNPARDGAVLPILHLNGFKIANPTVLARISREELTRPAARLRLRPALRGRRRPGARAPGARGHAGHHPRPHPRHSGRRPQRGCWQRGRPEGAPALADDRVPHPQRLDRAEDRRRQAGRRHLARPSGADRRRQDARAPEAQLEDWMRSYDPHELFGSDGKLREDLAALAPTGRRRMGSNPHANGGLLLQALAMPHFHEYAVAVPSPGAVHARKRRGCSAASCAT